MSTPTRVPLSGRIRPNCEAAPWVIEEVKRMEAQHTETVRLLEAAAKYVPINALKGDWRNKPIAEVRLLTQIDTHLATLRGENK